MFKLTPGSVLLKKGGERTDSLFIRRNNLGRLLIYLGLGGVIWMNTQTCWDSCSVGWGWWNNSDYTWIVTYSLVEFLRIDTIGIDGNAHKCHIAFMLLEKTKHSLPCRKVAVWLSVPQIDEKKNPSESLSLYRTRDRTRENTVIHTIWIQCEACLSKSLLKQLLASKDLLFLRLHCM